MEFRNLLHPGCVWQCLGGQKGENFHMERRNSFKSAAERKLSAKIKEFTRTDKSTQTTVLIEP